MAINQRGQRRSAASRTELIRAWDALKPEALAAFKMTREGQDVQVGLWESMKAVAAELGAPMSTLPPDPRERKPVLDSQGISDALHEYVIKKRAEIVKPKASYTYNDDIKFGWYDTRRGKFGVELWVQSPGKKYPDKTKKVKSDIAAERWLDQNVFSVPFKLNVGKLYAQAVEFLAAFNPHVMMPLGQVWTSPGGNEFGLVALPTELRFMPIQGGAVQGQGTPVEAIVDLVQAMHDMDGGKVKPKGESPALAPDGGVGLYRIYLTVQECEHEGDLQTATEYLDSIQGVSGVKVMARNFELQSWDDDESDDESAEVVLTYEGNLDAFKAKMGESPEAIFDIGRIKEKRAPVNPPQGDGGAPEDAPPSRFAQRSVKYLAENGGRRSFGGYVNFMRIQTMPDPDVLQGLVERNEDGEVVLTPKGMEYARARGWLKAEARAQVFVRVAEYVYFLRFMDGSEGRLPKRGRWYNEAVPDWFKRKVSRLAIGGDPVQVTSSQHDELLRLTKEFAAKRKADKKKYGN